MMQSVAPGVWVDRGPASATPTQRRYAAVPVLAVGQMVPVAGGGPQPVTNNEARRRAARNRRRNPQHATGINGTGPERCLEMMPGWGNQHTRSSAAAGPCWRFAGHTGQHSTKRAIEAAAERMRERRSR